MTSPRGMRPRSPWKSKRPATTPGVAAEASPIWKACRADPKSTSTSRKSTSDPVPARASGVWVKKS
jgi:hypothetical protein